MKNTLRPRVTLKAFFFFLIVVDLINYVSLHFLYLLYSYFFLDKHYCYTILYICIENICLITEQLRWQNILLLILQLLCRVTFFAVANKHTLFKFLHVL